MRAIFISYRRADAEGQAGRLFDDLTQHFGEDAVFMDVAALEAGRDFRRAIDEQVAACGVLLAIIGKNWLTDTDESGGRRLDDPTDFVRIETASALKRDIPVVPVLVQGARMPRATELPEDIKELAFRNAVELTHARWDSDLQLLIKALRPFVQPRPNSLNAASSPPTDARRTFSRVSVAAGAVVVAAALAGYMWYGNVRQAAPTEDTSQRNRQTPPQSPSATDAKNILSFRDWEGSWDLKWQFETTWYEKVLTMTATQTGIAGDYVLGTLEGRFAEGDYSKANGEIRNTTNTGTTCPSGQQSGTFLLTLARDGRHVEGWWDVCGQGAK